MFGPRTEGSISSYPLIDRLSFLRHSFPPGASLERAYLLPAFPPQEDGPQPTEAHSNCSFLQRTQGARSFPSHVSDRLLEPVLQHRPRLPPELVGGQFD